LAASPLECADSPIQLFRHVRVQDEVIETRRGIDASDLTDGYGDQRAHVVEVGFFPDRAQCCHCEVRAIERLEHEGAWPHTKLVVLVGDQVDGVVPKVEYPYGRAELAQCCRRALLSVEHRTVPDDRNETLGLSCRKIRRSGCHRRLSVRSLWLGS